MIKAIRERLGYSRYRMAIEMKMSQAGYTKLEVSGKGCFFKTLVRLKKVSGLSWEKIGKLLELKSG